MVVHGYNSCTQEDEEKESWVLGQPGIHNSTIYKTIPRNKTYFISYDCWQTITK